MSKPTRILFLAALWVAFVPARADENFLGYSYGSETLPKGHTELYQWITHRNGRESGTFRATDYYTEFEFGLTDRLQASLYLTAAHFKIKDVPGLDDRELTAFTGTRVSFKYAFTSPYKDGYGLAVYVEPEYATRHPASGESIREYALETKLIFQKNFREDSLIYIANFTAEPEIERAEGETHHELGAEFSHGLSYRVAPGWYVGLENRWTTKFDPLQVQHWEHYAAFLGPTIHYGAKQWWFTLTWMPQVTGWPATRHGLQLDENEKNEYRLKLGFNF